MSENRDNQLRIIEALIAPKSVYDFILALNTPDDRSPYKRKLINEIIEGVNIETILGELEVLSEINQQLTEKQRQEKIREWQEEESYELMKTSQAVQFQAEKENELKTIAMNLDIEKRIEYLTEVLHEESPKKEEYKQTYQEAKEELKAIDQAWEAREKNMALTFIEAHKKEHHYPSNAIGGSYHHQIGFKHEDEKRLMKAFTTAAPKKLIKMNAEVIDEAGDDTKKMQTAAHTMAAKGDCVRSLQVLAELSRMRETKQKKNHHTLKPSSLKKLCKRYKLHTKLDKDKEDIFNAIKKHKKMKAAKEKLLLIDNAEKLLKHAQKEYQNKGLMLTSGKAK